MNDRSGSPARSGWLGWAGLLVLLACALGVRYYRLGEYPHSFHTARQYYGVVKARDRYFSGRDDIPAWRREVASQVAASQPRGEIPILESISASVYSRLGREAFWVPRLVTTTCWVVGGIFLFLLATRFAGPAGSLAGVAFYLFAPYTIVASRSFQPDPIMMMLMLAAVLGVVRYAERPALPRLLAAGCSAGLALLVKPNGVYVLFVLWIVVSVARVGLKRTAIGGHSVAYMGLAFGPAVIYYGVFGVLISGFLRGYTRETAGLFHWFGAVFFWRGWMGCVIEVLTLPGLMLGAIGVVLTMGRGPRGLVLGWSLGYLVFCLVQQFPTATHDYYHLQIVPIAALGLACLADRVWGALAAGPFVRARRAAVLCAGAAWIVLGVATTEPFYSRPGPFDYVKVAREIGESVGHSTECVILDYDFGLSLCYFAEIAGYPWPEYAHLVEDNARGRAKRGIYDSSIAAEERWKNDYADRNPHYFVICRALRELDLQPDLRDFLFSRFKVHAQGERYIIFDLRNPPEAGHS